MKQCNRCWFYSKEHDILMRTGDDLPNEHGVFEEHHYCDQYEGAIPNGVVQDLTKCPYFAENNEIEEMLNSL